VFKKAPLQDAVSSSDESETMLPTMLAMQINDLPTDATSKNASMTLAGRSKSTSYMRRAVAKADATPAAFTMTSISPRFWEVLESSWTELKSDMSTF
jgi:hypothetical protein